ncbi:MAG TPA: GDSL-type esterase/lipase family protein [Elusimicrobiota bacterium]|nr:GDSL-type esterase/lipase family protein [Elusimicrobiota bacterium]
MALLALGVCLVELGLQAAAGFLSWRESRAAAGAGWSRAEVRILCLGESTTAPNEHAWPLQLQRLLDERAGPGRYAVINAAHGSTTSGILLARLPRLLERYRPQVVIAMMGVNDSRWFGIYEEGALSTSLWRRWRARLKLPKLLAYAYHEQWRQPDPKRTEEDLRRLNEADAKGAKKPESQAVYRRILASGDGSSATSAAGVRLAGTLPPVEAAKIYATLAENEGAEDGEDGLGGGGRFAAVDTPGADDGESAVTAANFRRMLALLRARGVRLAAMQYPTLALQALERATGNPNDVLFIGNEDNFRSALRHRRYDDLFIDRFGGEWGHCTAVGDHLIAENVFRRLVDSGLFPDEKRQRAARK